MGTSDVLATQRCPDQDTRGLALSGELFESWWRDYAPSLRAWDDQVELGAEWECHELL